MPLSTGTQRDTFAGYPDQDGNDLVERIGEEQFMLPPPDSAHQFICGELFAQLHRHLKGTECRVVAAPFGVRLFEQEGDTPEDVDTVVMPDLSVICDPGKIDARGCKGAPDLIVEILSPSTRRHDRLVKLGLYQRAGVKEYWIVDPENRSVQVFVKDGDFLHLAEDYGAADLAKVNVLADCSIRLDAVFAAAEW